MALNGNGFEKCNDAAQKIVGEMEGDQAMKGGMTNPKPIVENDRDEAIYCIKDAIKGVKMANESFSIIASFLRETRRNGDFVKGDDKLFCILKMLDTGVTEANDCLDSDAHIMEALSIALGHLEEGGLLILPSPAPELVQNQQIGYPLVIISKPRMPDFFIKGYPTL